MQRKEAGKRVLHEMPSKIRGYSVYGISFLIYGLCKLLRIRKDFRNFIKSCWIKLINLYLNNQI